MADIVLDVLGDRDIPVLGNVEVGHAGPNLPMPVGVRAALDAEKGTLSLLEPAVRRPPPRPPADRDSREGVGAGAAGSGGMGRGSQKRAGW
ncbi:hypothetical protein ACH4E8_09375 [Streptomyces sp. NPDC017979]|uniref:hypothetical protein n=1 Tax=Streptomyces sp. NPDC017979 TaxID=3365024 RepID=UPI003791CCF7